MNTSIYCSDGRRRNLIQKKRGGPWYLRFKLNGKEVWRSTQTNEIQVAKEKARKLFDSVTTGAGTDDTKTTFVQLVERFMASRIARAPKTRANDGSFFKVLSGSFPKMNALARQIRTGDLLAWLNAESLAAEARTGRPWRGRTFNSYRLYFKQIFDLAVADRLVTRDEHPFVSNLIKRRRQDKVVRNIPSAAQFAAIIADVRANHPGPLRLEFADLLEFYGLAGLGQAEARALRKCDIVGDRMKIIRKKTGAHFDVPIYQWLAPLLARRCAAVQDPAGHLFIDSEPCKPLEAACLRLGVTHFSPRNLRAMLIKRLYDAGIPAKQIALWQGHTDGGKLILTTYTEVFCDTDEAAEQANLAKVGGSVDSAAVLTVLPTPAVAS